MKLFRIWTTVCSSILALVLALTLVPSSVAANVSETPNDVVTIRTINLNFNGLVTEGPSRGTRIAGLLRLNVGDEGRIVGSLFLRDSHTQIPVRGFLRGGSITLTFDLGEGGIINGRGTFVGSSLRGTFFGPERGDRGVWSASPLH